MCWSWNAIKYFIEMNMDHIDHNPQEGGQVIEELGSKLES